MDRVFLVVGEAGSYSDHVEWPVRAFEKHADALAYVAECEAYMKTAPKRPDSYDWTKPHERDSYDKEYREVYQPALQAWVAASPDASMPSDGDADYGVTEVPFGKDSTALQTQPARIRPTVRHYHEEEFT